MLPQDAIKTLETMRLAANAEIPSVSLGEREEVIEILKMAIEALKKQIPAEPIFERVGVYAYAYCPSCKFERAWRDRNYCPRCGQKLDFSYVNDK